MAKRYKVVDLGTKKGGALDVFRNKGGVMYFGAAGGARPEQCLGIDMKERYRKIVESKGYAFAQLNPLDTGFQWPDADFYLAFDFLEHLPTAIHSNLVLRRMLEHARKGVWLRMPSFEDDAVDHPQLKKHKLRLSWTTWRGHPSHYRLDDVGHTVRQVRSETDKFVLRVKTKEAKPIKTSASPWIVPSSVGTDVEKYKKGLPPKPKVTFKPPIVGQYEVIIYKDYV